jgi:DNA-binding CsgD family transcriptional regulator
VGQNLGFDLNIMGCEFSIYEIMQILGISVIDKTHVNQILTKLKNKNDVKV